MSGSSSISDALKKGLAAHECGDFKTADKFYSFILRSNPDHPHANYNLGKLAVEIGKVDAALPYLQRSVDSSPLELKFWQAYLSAVIQLGRHAEAEFILQRALHAGHSETSLPKINVTKSKNKNLANVQHDTQMQEINSIAEANRAVKEAQRYITIGKVSEGVELIHAVLRKYPAHKKAKEALLKVSQQEKPVTREGKVEPNEKDLQMHIEAIGRGDYQKVLLLSDQSLQEFPNSATLYNLIGLSHMNLKNFMEAEINFQKSIKLNPRYAEAFNNLGLLNEEIENLEEALSAYQSALKINNNYTLAYNNIGNTYFKLGQYKKAISSYELAIESNPEYVPAYRNLAILQMKVGESQKALETCNQAIQYGGKTTENLNIQAEIYIKKGFLEDASDTLNESITLNSKEPRTLLLLGNLYRQLDKYNDAIEMYKKAIELEKSSALLFYNLGVCYSDLGDDQNAFDNYKVALALDPGNPTMIRSLLRVQNSQDDDDTIEANINKLLKYLKDPDQLAELYYALHLVHHKTKNYSKAYKALTDGGLFQTKFLNYHFADDQTEFKYLHQVSETLSSLKCRHPESIKNFTPIFIVGMPRSGTSLLEFHLSKHPRVYACGELDYFNFVMRELLGDISNLKDKNYGKIAVQYVRQVQFRVGGSAEFIIDKMPHNFRNIPILVNAFPNCKIIHIKRDKKATCWSNFKEYFAGGVLGYSYSIDNTINYYNLYEQLTKENQVLYSENVINISYENFVEKPDIALQKLFDFIGLDFTIDERGQSAQRAVRTASSTQVKKEIYSGSNLQWKKYEEFLPAHFKSL